MRSRGSDGSDSMAISTDTSSVSSVCVVRASSGKFGSWNRRGDEAAPAGCDSEPAIHSRELRRVVRELEGSIVVHGLSRRLRGGAPQPHEGVVSRSLRFQSASAV